MYLANRGYRCANVPFVPGGILPGSLDTLKGPLIVGLEVNADMLVQIRKNRMLSIKNETETLYTDRDEIKKELAEARKYFTKNNWPILDVSRRSVEEVAAQVIKLFNERQAKQ